MMSSGTRWLSASSGTPDRSMAILGGLRMRLQAGLLESVQLRVQEKCVKGAYFHQILQVTTHRKILLSLHL